MMGWSKEEKKTRAMRMITIGDLFLVRRSFVVHKGVFCGGLCFWLLVAFFRVDRGGRYPIGVPCQWISPRVHQSFSSRCGMK